MPIAAAAMPLIFSPPLFLLMRRFAACYAAYFRRQPLLLTPAPYAEFSFLPLSFAAAIYCYMLYAMPPCCHYAMPPRLRDTNISILPP